VGRLTLLDTNIVIYYLDGTIKKDPSPEDPALSVITVAELLSKQGLPEENEQKIQELVDKVRVIPVDQKIAERAAHLRRIRGVKLPDALIAATAMENNATLWTRDSELMNKLIPDGLRVFSPKLTTSEG